MATIFMSYRRDDTADVAGRIYDRLIAHFGREQVYKDVDSIPLGVDFRQHLDQNVGKTDVVLVIIGRRWLDVTDGTGTRRLENPADYVRVEIEHALARGIPVVPVCVQGADVPRPDQLPPSIAALSYRNAIQVRTDPDFHHDMDRMIHNLEALAPAGAEVAPASMSAPTPVQAAPAPAATSATPANADAARQRKVGGAAWLVAGGVLAVIAGRIGWGVVGFSYHTCYYYYPDPTNLDGCYGNTGFKYVGALSIISALTLPFVIWAIWRGLRLGQSRRALVMGVLALPLAFALSAGLVPILGALSGVSPSDTRRQDAALTILGSIVSLAGIVVWIGLSGTAAFISNDYYSDPRPGAFWTCCVILAIVTLPLTIWVAVRLARAGRRGVATLATLAFVAFSFGLAGGFVPLVYGLVGLLAERPARQEAPAPAGVPAGVTSWT